MNRVTLDGSPNVLIARVVTVHSVRVSLTREVADFVCHSKAVRGLCIDSADLLTRADSKKDDKELVISAAYAKSRARLNATNRNS